MNEKQNELYKEWKRIEIDTTLEAEVGSKKGLYTPRYRKPDDILNLPLIRERVWSELRELLPKEEREQLGFDLGKDAKEVFDIK